MDSTKASLMEEFMLDMDYDEFIPVDFFFQGYLDALDQPEAVLNSNKGSGQAVTLAPEHVHDNPSPAVSASVLMPLPAPYGGPQHGPDVPVLSPEADALPPSPHHMAVRDGTDVRNNQNATYSVQEVHRGAANDAEWPEEPSLGRMALPLQSRSRTSTSGRARAKGGDPQSKAERQQAMNKAAQQRYRERKKVKALELEQAVACLQEKVSELSVVQAQKVDLQEKVVSLEKELAVKEAQLMQAQCGVSHSANEGSSQSFTPPLPLGDASFRDLTTNFIAAVDELQSFVDHHNCGEKTTYQDLAPEHREEVRRLTFAVYQLCVRIHRVWGEVDICSLLCADTKVAKTRVCDLDGGPDAWKQLLAQLQLSPEARSKLLDLRESYFGRLDSIYTERKSLNLESVKALLPEDFGGQGVGKGDWVGFATYIKRKTALHAQTTTLERLRSNLHEEQKILAELDYLVLNRLLDPLQNAKCTLAFAPRHCDSISLINVLSGN